MSDSALVPVFIPALVVLLHRAETLKGSPLNEIEVIAIRDQGSCIMMDENDAIALDEKRGYADLDPENVWPAWQEARARLAEG